MFAGLGRGEVEDVERGQVKVNDRGEVREWGQGLNI